MRYYLFLTVIFLTPISSMAIDLDKRVVSALEYIKQGYTQYGYGELNKVAATNEIAAQYYVAACYEYGIGVEKNLTEAFKMYRKAAERGLPDAMFHLAAFYRNGLVVSQDSYREKEWMNRYQQKGGELLLPEILEIYGEGLNFPEHCSLNPNDENNNHSNLLVQNKGNIRTREQTINNITIIPQTSMPIGGTMQQTDNQTTAQLGSDIDNDIPFTEQRQEKNFAVIIGNEQYTQVVKVPHAVNDANVFAEYCQKTLGMPTNNVRQYNNATFGMMLTAINDIKSIVQAYKGEVNVIFYYAGHGIPDETTHDAFLLPVDANGRQTEACYPVSRLYKELGEMGAKNVIVFMDACFSGSQRGEGMLASARGVAIKVKANAPQGNMVVFSAATGDETAYPYQEKRHGMFTYFLLKKLRESKGDCTLGELGEYIQTNVQQQSVVVNHKSQTPTIVSSGTMVDSWRSLKLK